MKIGIAADHGGFALKATLEQSLRDLGEYRRKSSGIAD